MITGVINDKLEPLLDDIFIEGKNGWIPLRTILDTGFNSTFCLPRKYLEEAKMAFLTEIEAELCDGRIIIEEAYLGTVLVNNQPHVVEITLTDSETAVMGMEMLLEKEAIFNLKTMTVEVK
jgi:predicted aspartyl protease